MELFITKIATYENADETSDPVNSYVSEVLCQTVEDCHALAKSIIDEDFPLRDFEYDGRTPMEIGYKEADIEIIFAFTKVKSIR